MKKCKLYGLEFAAAAQAQCHAATGKRIQGPADVAEIISPIIGKVEQEQFWVILLNAKHYIIGLHLATQGLVDRSQIHAREVFRWAVADLASAVILVHNHPSGDPTPSPQDLECTKTLTAAGKIIGITVLDHIIIGNDTPAAPLHIRQITSFRESALL